MSVPTILLLLLAALPSIFPVASAAGECHATVTTYVASARCGDGAWWVGGAVPLCSPSACYPNNHYASCDVFLTGPGAGCWFF